MPVHRPRCEDGGTAIATSGGSPYAEPARPAMRARASPERSHLRPGQPVPGSCPASPSAAAGLAVPPAIMLQSLRRRHRCQFCSPQPWQLEGQQYTTTSHTPRWPAPSAPRGPAQPPFASPPAPPIKSHLSSSANAAAAPRQRPGRLADLCMPSHAPHSPPAWIDQLTAPPAPTTACRVMKHTIDRNRKHEPSKGLISKKSSRPAARARAPPLLRSNTLNLMALQIRVGA